MAEKSSEHRKSEKRRKLAKWGNPAEKKKKEHDRRSDVRRVVN